MFSIFGHRRHFESLDEATQWVSEKILGHVLAPYTAMIKLVHETTAFLHSLRPSVRNVPDEMLSNIVLSCTTIDASQGDTLSCVTSATPDNDAWTKFASEPERIITMISKAFRTISFPYTSQYNSRDDDNTENVCDESLHALFELQGKADFV